MTSSEADEKFFAEYGHEPLHAETEMLLDRFTHALKLKLLKAQHKYGYKDNWARRDWETECREELTRHVAKGDPLDVAAYCAFMFHHGWSTGEKSRCTRR